MIADVIARLDAQVSGLAGRVEGAAEFAALVASNALPQHTPAAHVLPLGLNAGPADTATGLHRQMVEEAVGVVLTLRTYTATGSGEMPELESLVTGVIAALAGWGPAGAIGVFRLVRGNLVSMRAGTIVYQIDFAIDDQLRIST